MIWLSKANWVPKHKYLFSVVFYSATARDWKFEKLVKTLQFSLMFDLNITILLIKIFKNVWMECALFVASDENMLLQALLSWLSEDLNILELTHIDFALRDLIKNFRGF